MKNYLPFKPEINLRPIIVSWLAQKDETPEAIATAAALEFIYLYC